jgi:hypothetical protein
VADVEVDETIHNAHAQSSSRQKFVGQHTRLWQHLPVGYGYFNLPQSAQDLLQTSLLPSCHIPFLLISFSSSNWCKKGRAFQFSSDPSSCRDEFYFHTARGYTFIFTAILQILTNLQARKVFTFIQSARRNYENVGQLDGTRHRSRRGGSTD